ncbi:hypothetical protein K1719_000805 [Acacia pycnantha]|nr:hypothetical protein K1719_000805 [Acacia pycnantha]
MMEEELQRMKEASQSDPSICYPSPQRPPRHKKWKAARMKGDKYINEDVAAVASKIDSLEQQSSQGSFTPVRGRHFVDGDWEADYPDAVRGERVSQNFRTTFTFALPSHGSSFGRLILLRCGRHLRWMNKLRAYFRT